MKRAASYLGCAHKLVVHINKGNTTLYACRAKAVLLLLKKEVELCKLQQDIREQVRG
jgi:hypothetical protein